MRVSIRNNVMYLYTIGASAGDTPMLVPIQGFAAAGLPFSDIRGSVTASPEMALLTPTDLGIAFLPAFQPAAYAIRRFPDTEGFSADDTSADFSMFVSPSRREVAFRGAIFRIEAGRLRTAYVERLPAVFARPIAARRLPAGDTLGALVPGRLVWHREFAGVRTVGFADGTSERIAATFACLFEALHIRLYQLQPRKESYYRQAVKNIRDALTVGEEYTDLFSSLLDEEEEESVDPDEAEATP
jgi:hypothetical protein